MISEQFVQKRYPRGSYIIDEWRPHFINQGHDYKEKLSQSGPFILPLKDFLFDLILPLKDVTA
jgi:hypothetical protein